MENHLKSKITAFRKSLAKIVFDKRIKNNETLDIANAKNILFLRQDNKIGDMVVLTLVFREIKKRYPKIKIIVLCGKDNKEIINNNPNVDEIIEVSGKLVKDCKIYKSLKNKKIDIAVDFFIFRPRPGHLFMIRKIAPEFLVGFHKQNYNMYDLSINCDTNELHISKRYEILLKEFGIETPSLNYDIYLNSDDEEIAKKTFKDESGNNLIINPFAASKHRSFSFEKLQDLVNELKKLKDLNIFVVCSKSSSASLKGLKGAKNIESGSILESAAFIKYCDYVISPDTSIVHVAAAFKKKMIALFLDYSEADEKINKVWAPGYSEAIEISVDTNNGMLENDINNIDNKLIIDAFNKIIFTGKKQ